MSTETPEGEFAELLNSVIQCRICEASLPLGPRPVLQVHPRARILIAGQAPGRRVHESGVPFDDPRRDRLREGGGLTKTGTVDAPAKAKSEGITSRFLKKLSGIFGTKKK